MEDFLKRQDYLEIIRKRVESLRSGYKQNIAILGDEAIGKTSLILDYLKGFCDSRIIPIYLEIKPEPMEYFVRRFLGSLLYNFLKNSEIELKEDLEYLITKAAKYIPQTANKIKTTIDLKANNRKDLLFGALFSICESINKETSKACLIIFDEFQNLETLGTKSLYRIWSKALISQKNVMYILISSRKHRAKQILSQNLSLLFGNFETLEIEPLNPKESDEFIKRLVQPFELAKEYRDFLIHFTGGHPYYLKIICQTLLKNSASAGIYAITEESLIRSLKELLFEEMGTLNLRFSNYLKDFSADGLNQEYTRMLYLISCGHNRIKDLTIELRKQNKHLLPKINRLIELDILQRYGDFFKINDRVFSFWLRFVYQEKSTTFSADTESKIDIFKNKIAELLREFIQDTQRPIFNRILELLQLFGNESLHIERKRLRLSQFREIKPLKFRGRLLKEGILGRTSHDIWIIAFSNESITEEDVAEFALECKKYKNNRMQKKIIVSTRNIESNARLKALEEKILPWNLDNLNFILDLFSKSRIIV
ncbi:MAG: hypothetical protein NC914_01295 [Candidatus Omnitrophica bacterium]|nr:hypothetical protein [Candidatus Omnitrophota bacterium]